MVSVDHTGILSKVNSDTILNIVWIPSFIQATTTSLIYHTLFSQSCTAQHVVCPFHYSSTQALRFKIFFFPSLKVLNISFALYFNTLKFNRFYILLTPFPRLSYSAIIHGKLYLLTFNLALHSARDVLALIILSQVPHHRR